MLLSNLSEVAEVLDVPLQGAGADATTQPAAADGLLTSVSIDTRTLRSGALFVALRGPNHDGHDYLHVAVERGAAALLVEGAPDSTVRKRRLPDFVPILEVDDAREALIRLATAARRRLRCPVVGVLGSNGKTTCKEMLGRVLGAPQRGTIAPRSFNNALGVSLTLLAARPDDAFVVLEIGTNAPGEIAALCDFARPTHVLLTSIGEEHLAGLGDLKGVAREEAAGLTAVPPDGCCVINVEQSVIEPYLSDVKGKLLTYGRTARAAFEVPEGAALEGAVVVDNLGAIDVPLDGVHHLVNAVGVILMARELGVAVANAVDALRGFQLPEGRGECIDLQGISVLDDSYNANPASMRAALKRLAEHDAAQRHASRETQPAPGRRVAVLGAMAELGPERAAWHAEIGRYAAELRIDHLVLVGVEAEQYARDLADHDGHGAGSSGSAAASLRVSHCIDVDSAVELLAHQLAPGDTVLVKASRRSRLERVIDGLRHATIGPRTGALHATRASHAPDAPSGPTR